MKITKDKSKKKALLKKIIKGKSKNPKGKSPFKMDGGLGKVPLTTPNLTGGSGSNLGKNGIF
jgi:hypothetical protein